nr:hypothetical protein [Tanacetum cinerariifolium]
LVGITTWGSFGAALDSLRGSCLCWGEVEKVVGSGVEVVEWTGVEKSGGKAVGGKTW